MRRLGAITAFAFFLAVPAWAQHGGGHAGGFGGGHGGSFSGGHGGGFASHGGFAGGHGGFSGAHAVGGHSFSGVHGPGMSRGFTHVPSTHARMSRGFTHVPSSNARMSRRFTHVPSTRAGMSRRPFLHDGLRDSRFRQHRFGDHRFRNNDGDFDNDFDDDRDFGFRNNCFGVGCWGFGYPWWYAGIDPWWWWDSRSSYDEDYERDRALANEMNAQNLQEQQMLRQEQADGDQDAYARPPRREQEKPEPEGAAILPATVLVFRDQHKLEVQNYAIVGQTLWAFAPQHQKIALSELDLAATTKANDDRGVTFRAPTANGAQ